MAKPDKDWEIEDAARTLIKAEEIKNDSKLFKAAIKEVQKRQEEALNVLKIHGSQTKGE